MNATQERICSFVMPRSNTAVLLQTCKEVLDEVTVHWPVAAALMSLVQLAKLNGHDPFAYLKDVLTRLPTHKASRIGELLPHRWQATFVAV